MMFLYLPSTKVQENKSLYVSKSILIFWGGNWRKRNLEFYFYVVVVIVVVVFSVEKVTRKIKKLSERE